MTETNILVVEDDKDFAQTLELCLQNHGADVVHTPVDALEMLANNDYKLLMTDYHMPEMNGLSLIKEALERGYNGKIIMVTGSDIGKQDFPIYKKGQPGVLFQLIEDINEFLYN